MTGTLNKEILHANNRRGKGAGGNMKQYRLNGWQMGTKEKAHRHLKKRLRLPDYYGNNIDALCDCLCEIGEPVQITLTHANWMRAHLGEYGTRLISAMLACTGENPRVHVCIREKW